MSQLRIIIPIPEKGFDPTETAVPWQFLTTSGCLVTFSTPRGSSGPPAVADPIMVTGIGLYALKWSMRADPVGRLAYDALLSSGSLSKTVPYSELAVEQYDALLLPGGHCPDMKPYLEDKSLQLFIKAFFDSGKPVAAVCHGVVLAARSGILCGRRVTALPSWMESLAFNLTRLWMGSYYKTYEGTSVEAEVTAAAKEFLPGPKSLTRDSPTNLTAGFVMRDNNLLTARWPGDCHALAFHLLNMLNEKRSSKNH